MNGLDQLAHEAGIQPGYLDYKGTFYSTSDETKMVLLQAMGILPEGIDAETVVAARREEAWKQLLPKVIVSSEGNIPLSVPLVLEENELSRHFHYHLSIDQGESSSGYVHPDSLPSSGQNSIEGRLYKRFEMEFKGHLPPGYHRLTLTTDRHEATVPIIIAPAACYLPQVLKDEKLLWGSGIQLPSLRSQRNWGIGDLGDVEQLIGITADIGGDFVGLSPLHAFSPNKSKQGNSFATSNRFFTDFLFIDPCRVAEYSEECFLDSPWNALLAECKNAGLIDYEGVSKIKIAALRTMYRDFCKYHLSISSDRADQFQLFKAAGGVYLYRQALYLALQEFFSSSDTSVHGWLQWPAAFHHPTSEAVQNFARENQELVGFYYYVLWQSELQLAACGKRSLDGKLGVGLCLKMAAGVQANGSEVWMNQPLYTTAATIGSPPDDTHPDGLEWGLAPIIPFRLVDAAYAPFIALLRFNMHYAGALQVVHPNQLMRQFWIPEGHSPKDGAYVNYPMQDLLSILALESIRNKCMVIGEEAPTMEETEETLQKRNIYSCRFLFHEKDGNGVLGSPKDYPSKSLAKVSCFSHPTLASFWKGDDIACYEEHPRSFAVGKKHDDALERRRAEKKILLKALDREGLLLPESIVSDSHGFWEMTGPLNRAIHRYLSRSPAQLVMVQLGDIFLVREENYLSGEESDQYARSCRWPFLLEELALSPALNDIVAAIKSERSREVMPAELRGRRPLEAVIPRATYRLQLNSRFTFADAAAIVPYLAELGISHCYTSPCFAARTGSSHGYDVVNPTKLNAEMGGMEGFLQLNRFLKKNGMGQILDIVPNHMGVMGSDNQWWLDVLENGPSSFFAPFFDIDWEPVKSELRHKILVPVLGEPYGLALEQGKLTLSVDFQSGSFAIFYYHHCFPLDPCTYSLILSQRIDILGIRLGHETSELIELHSLITAFGQLPPYTETDEKKILIRRRDKEILKKRLAQLMARSPDIHRQLEETAAEYNNPSVTNFHAFHTLLEAQPFRLAYWKVAADEINYRRFFNINDLAALCVEKEKVFEMTHRLIIDLVQQGLVEGLRIDHPDGLYDPAQYYRRLTRRLLSPATEKTGPSVYLAVEKILASFEHLPEEWPVHGTTGYDFANLISKLFVDSSAEEQLLAIYHRFTSITDDFDTILYQSKKRIMRFILASELNVLANRLDNLSELNWQTRDFTLNSLREALAEVAACFPVYRTYVSEDTISCQDRNYIEWAIAQAKKNSLGTDLTIFDFLHSILLLEPIAGMDHEFRRMAADFARRFQQFTSSVMAKGMEDTAFYRYNPLVSLNEVGGNPRRFGASIAAFHRLNRERADRWPHAMLATSTHDSKRSEDLRCRLNVLSEMPKKWQIRLVNWGKMNQPYKSKIDGRSAPSANDEYFLYQNLLGIWPLHPIDAEDLSSIRRRIKAYMEKACREAKVQTSWEQPNMLYEQAVSSFVDAILANESTAFIKDFVQFQSMIARLGLYNSLSQCLLKLSVPGVPDIYQGCELWNFHLVDPDNRQPIDYNLRRSMLENLQQRMAQAVENQAELVSELFENMADGRIKLFTTWVLLQFRRQHRELFEQGSYMHLFAEGEKSEHVCAFARRFGKSLVVSAAARFFVSLTDCGEKMPCGPTWGNTSLEIPISGIAGRWRNIFTGALLQPHRTEDGRQVFFMEEMFQHLPIAFLQYED